MIRFGSAESFFGGEKRFVKNNGQNDNIKGLVFSKYRMMLH